MRILREDAFQALVMKLTAAVHPITNQPAFTQVSRNLKTPAEVDPLLQPACFIVKSKDAERPMQRKGLPPMWILFAEAFIYDNWSNDPTAIPDQRMNYLLDAVDRAIAPSGISETQTLGGVVSHCWIGSLHGPTAAQYVVYSGGYEGVNAQSVAVVPIEILVPDSSGP